ncbi:unnamed protein product [Heterobilharzia americana]|nr:unnamed protein product [Heterobilharzia americana]
MQLGLENPSNSDYTINCPPTLEAGVYYPENNSLYATYSYHLNPINAKYNPGNNNSTIYAYNNESKQLIPIENASEYMPQLISGIFTNGQS